MQFHIPSVVHAVPAAVADPDPVVPVLAGGEADATGVDAAGGAACDAMGLEAAADATGAEVACDPDEGLATVAKTPPGRPVPEAAGADEAWGAAGAELAPAPDDPVAAGAATTAPQDGPVGGLGVSVDNPNCSREAPGSGKARSCESWVVQVVAGIFATNILGRELKAAWSRSMSWVMLRAMSSSSSALRLEEPAVIVTGAQFMYISRLPTLLNQVQAKVAVPVGRLVGTVKE